MRHWDAAQFAPENSRLFTQTQNCIMSLRPGISDETITRLGIRRVTDVEAKVLTGVAKSGIYIPFKGVMCFGGAYGRLRLDSPIGDMKYHQRKGSKVHNYIQEGLTLHNGDLILIEGEFKAISLTEAGFPAVGTSGLHSWGKKVKRIAGLPLEDRDETDVIDKKTAKSGANTEEIFLVLHREIQALITKLSPQRVIYVGDPDTALNLSFGDAMSKFANLLPCPLALVRIPYDAPHGKGVDDIRESMGQEAFATWFQEALSAATVIAPKTPQEAIISALIERERPTFSGLMGGKKDKAIDQLSKLYASLAKKRHKEAKALVTTVEELTRDVFNISTTEFAVMVGAVAEKRQAKWDAEKKQRAEDECKAKAAVKSAPVSPLAIEPSVVSAEPAAATSTTPAAPPIASGGTGIPSAPTPFDSTVFDPEDTLNSFVMVGEDYYTYSYVKVGATYRRSKVMSACGRNYVSQALKAAGFSSDKPSTPSLPVVGEIPHLSQLQAAMFYLSATRCAGTTNLLFRPYGPLEQPDGTRLFNTSLVRVMEPKDTVTTTDDPRIAAILGWLTMFFGADDAFEHFISLLSYVYKAARAGTPKKTRAVFFLGPPNSGKSLLIDKIVPMIFGQATAADAHRLIRGEAGTTSILGSYVCKLSDKDLGGPNEIRRVQQGVLSLLADHTMGGRALFEDVKTIDVINLFMFSSNPDGSVVKMLEGMPSSIIEKFAIYEGGFNMEHVKAFQSVSRDKPMGSKDLIAEIIESLPYFCSFLNNWNGSRYHEDRFGVIKFVPEKFTKPSTLGPKEELIKELLLQHGDFHSDSGTAIYKGLCRNEETKNLLSSIEPTRMVSILTRLSQVEPDLVTCVPYEKSKYFSVTVTAYKTKHGIGADAPTPAPAPASAAASEALGDSAQPLAS